MHEINLNSVNEADSSKSISAKIENIQQLKKSLECKMNKAHSLKESALEHSMMADEILKSHHRELESKLSEEEAEKAAIKKEMEIKLQERMKQVEMDERKRLEDHFKEEFQRKKREAEAKRLADEAEAKIKKEMEEADLTVYLKELVKAAFVELVKAGVPANEAAAQALEKVKADMMNRPSSRE